jgi:uncharacterized protein (AIM24 family)
LMLVSFRNEGTEGTGEVVLGPSFYSKLVAVDLREYGGTIVCAKDSFIVGPEDTTVDVHVIRSFMSLIGGEGVLLQKISGSGLILIKASGAVQSIYLGDGESMLLHPGTLVGYESTTVSYEVQTIAGAKNVLFGQGLFLVKVTGPGKVILQTMSETKFVQSLHISAGASSSLLLNPLIYPVPVGAPADTPPDSNQENAASEGVEKEGEAASPQEENEGDTAPVEDAAPVEDREPESMEEESGGGDADGGESYTGGNEEGGTWLGEAVEWLKSIFSGGD